MLLAAGRGERMRPLTDDAPKPLLHAGGRALIDYHLSALAAAGVTDVVVNLSWQAEQLRAYLGTGSAHGLNVILSEEGPVPLETGGGIQRALDSLGAEPFLLISADIWTDYPLASLALPAGSLAHLVLVPNPPYHQAGDYPLGADGRVTSDGARLTYGNMACLHPDLFAGWRPGRFPLKPVLDKAQAAGRLTAERWDGHWFNVGTPQILAELDAALRRGELVHPQLAAISDAAGRPR